MHLSNRWKCQNQAQHQFPKLVRALSRIDDHIFLLTLMGSFYRALPSVELETDSNWCAFINRFSRLEDNKISARPKSRGEMLSTGGTFFSGTGLFVGGFWNSFWALRARSTRPEIARIWPVARMCATDCAIRRWTLIGNPVNCANFRGDVNAWLVGAFLENTSFG